MLNYVCFVLRKPNEFKQTIFKMLTACRKSINTTSLFIKRSLYPYSPYERFQLIHLVKHTVSIFLDGYPLI